MDLSGMADNGCSAAIAGGEKTAAEMATRKEAASEVLRMSFSIASKSGQVYEKRNGGAHVLRHKEWRQVDFEATSGPEANVHRSGFSQDPSHWLTKAGLLYDQFIQGHA